tara:strand:- start:2312 stop:2701 length:390 start_codon:yes stop_codon:yes gene_type:complete
MKFYIATRYSNEALRQKAIELKEKLEKQGHSKTLDWMSAPNLRPYAENSTDCTEVSKKLLEAVNEADVFVLIPDKNGTGMYVEYGAALQRLISSGSPQIYIVGEQKDCSIFNFHPAVRWIDDINNIDGL